MAVEQSNLIEGAVPPGAARLPGGAAPLPGGATRLPGRLAAAARTGRRWRGPASFAIVTLLLAAATLTWWSLQATPPSRYLTVPVMRGAVTRTITATGTVNPELTIIIGSYVSGVIRSMQCDYNTRVKRGQLCAKIDPRPYQAALDQAKGQLARDIGQLEGAQADLKRYKTLLGQDSIAVQTYEDQLALVHQLEGSVELDRGAVESAEVNLDYTNIVSPVDGTVVARNITIGQTVAATLQTPTLFLIASDLTKMEVDTNVAESDVGGVKVGDTAQFSVEAFTRPFSGTVTQVRQAPQTVQNVTTYDVVVGVDNSGFLLMPGMTATVAIVTDRRANVLRVPDQALRFAPSGAAAAKPAAPPSGISSAGGPTSGGAAAQRAHIWTLSNGRPVPIEITTGLDDDTNTEVIAGNLTVGTPVIVGEQRARSSAPAAPFRFGL